MIKVSKYLIPYIILLMIVGFKGELIISFIIVIFHEMIHYLTARYFGFDGFDVEILPMGTRLKLKDFDNATPMEDLVISISGPLINLILAAFFYLLMNVSSFAYTSLFFWGNLTIGMFNLLPALPLDGGRILRDILSLKTYYRKANKITVYTSICIGSLMILIYIVLFFKLKNNFTIGFVALFIIVSSLKERERIAYIIMGDIIKKRFNFIKKGYIANRSVSVYYKKDLLSILSMVDKNKYNIFTVLDDDMKVMDIIYEEEIIEALKIYGNIRIDEFIKIDTGHI